jgi:hypothetical protein
LGEISSFAFFPGDNRFSWNPPRCRPRQVSIRVSLRRGIFRIGQWLAWDTSAVSPQRAMTNCQAEIGAYWLPTASLTRDEATAWWTHQERVQCTQWTKLLDDWTRCVCGSSECVCSLKPTEIDVPSCQADDFFAVCHDRELTRHHCRVPAQPSGATPVWRRPWRPSQPRTRAGSSWQLCA